ARRGLVRLLPRRLPGRRARRLVAQCLLLPRRHAAAEDVHALPARPRGRTAARHAPGRKGPRRTRDRRGPGVNAMKPRATGPAGRRRGDSSPRWRMMAILVWLAAATILACPSSAATGGGDGRQATAPALHATAPPGEIEALLDSLRQLGSATPGGARPIESPTRSSAGVRGATTPAPGAKGATKRDAWTGVAGPLSPESDASDSAGPAGPGRGPTR